MFYKQSIKFFLALMLTLIFTFSTIVPLNSFAENESYDYKYGSILEQGNNVEGNLTCLFEIKDQAGKSFPTYCIDAKTPIKNNYEYARVNISDGNYFSYSNANRIRAIIRNTYPFVSLQTLQAKSKLPTLTKKQAITSSQCAIWSLANNTKYDLPDSTTKKLFEYLTTLDATEPATIIHEIKESYSTSLTRGHATITIHYSCDDPSIKLTPTFSENLVQKYNAQVSPVENLANGTHQLTISNLPANASFTFTATGEQQVDYDGYFYYPKGGRTQSQSLVGAYSGKTSFSKSMDIAVEKLDHNSIHIDKVDSVTLKGLPGAVFQISTDKNFKENVQTLTTNESGKAFAQNLATGTWYVKEIQAPNGYIPYEKVMEVSVGPNEPTFLQCKNTAYGSVEIYKVSEEGAPLEGAVFSIYKGTEANADALLHSGITTNKEGRFLVEQLEPDQYYTIVETKAPTGYHKDSKPQTVKALPGKKVEVTFENIKIKNGHLKIIKLDAITNLPLSGATIGVYEDQECKKELKQFTSSQEPELLNELKPGTYYVKELKAPSSYVLDSQVYTVEIKESETATVTIYNRKIPITAGNYGLFMLLGGIFVVGLGSIICYRKIKKSKN